MDIIRTVSATLQEQLGSHLDQLARQCGLVLRERKFTGRSLLRMLVLTLLRKPDASWGDFFVTAIEEGLEVSATAVEKRLQAGQPLTDFLRQALERALQQVVTAVPPSTELLQPFSAVLLGDSSVISLPDELADAFAGCGGTEKASRAALKLHVLWNLKSGTLEPFVVTAGTVSDAQGPIAVDQAAPGTLWVYDLGYFDVERFAALDRQRAKFLSRLQHGTSVYQAQGQALDLVAHLRAVPTGLLDQMILLGATTRLLCRLLAIRVPEEVANRRRQQARTKARDHGRNAPSAAYLELLGWSLFVTNALAAEELSWKAVVVLYRARWQIELLFKLWKSHNGLARVRVRASALQPLAVFYAKLLGVLWQHWLLLALVWHLPERSLLRAARHLREWLKVLEWVLDDSAQVERLLQRLQRQMERLAGVKKRRKNPSHAQLLDEPELLDWLT
jgi:hypothetical protein